jgi:hypothetical protein
VIEKAIKICPTLKIFWADAGYTGDLISRVKTLWLMLCFEVLIGNVVLLVLMARYPLNREA